MAEPVHALLRRSRLAFFYAALLGALAVSSSSDARADDRLVPAAPPVSRHEILQDLDSYYGGEAVSAYVVIGLSVISVGTGSVLVTRSGDFARGFGWPLLTLGALEGPGALFYAFQVGAETRHYEAALAHDPTEFQQEERAHIQGTTRRFIFYRLTELGLTLGGAGVAIYGFASNRDVWKGLGLGVASIGLPFLIIDSVNNVRAARYGDALNNFDPQVANRLTTKSGDDLSTEQQPTLRLPATPWTFSYRGRF